MKYVFWVIFVLWVTLSTYLSHKYCELNSELSFVKEANAYKAECLDYADAYIVASDSLIEELERNNMLPDESYNLENMLIYKAKLDSMYSLEL